MENFVKIAEVFRGILWGLIILLVGYFSYIILIIYKNNGALSKKRKAFAFLAAFVVLGLSIWPLYLGITVHDRSCFAIGLFMIILGVAIPATIPFLSSPVEPRSPSDGPIDHEG